MRCKLVTRTRLRLYRRPDGSNGVDGEPGRGKHIGGKHIDHIDPARRSLPLNQRSGLFGDGELHLALFVDTRMQHLVVE